MMYRLLVILENDDVPEEQNLALATQELIGGRIESVVFEPVTGFPDRLPEETAGVIVGGGLPSVNDSKRWIEDEIALVRWTAGRRIPVLGLCFGHQLIAKAFGAGVVRRERRVGFAEIVKVGDDPLLRGMPARWRSPVYHQDRVPAVPEGFELIATSDYCAVQAMAHTELPVWSTQFHPEIGYGTNERFARQVPEWDDEAAFDSAPNRRLIDNFISICLNQR